MNLLLVTETYPPEINGVARTLAQVVDGMTALGHRVTLVCPAQRPDRHPPQADAAQGLEIHPVRGLPLPGYPGLQFGLPAQRLFNRLLSDGAIDVAYIATEGPLGRSAQRACERRDVPALSGLHTNFHQYSGHYGAGMLAPLLLRYLRRFHNRLAGTLVPTGLMADELHAIGFERLHVWPRGVHADQFSPHHRDSGLRAAWGLGEHDLAVLYVGRLAPEKNIDDAFEAFSALRRGQPTARFILVGDGPSEQLLRERHPDAIFAGARVGDDLAAHYASGDLFLFPSQTETFGNVTLEAMASGLAVVAYDLAAAHELILNGHNGLLADPQSASVFVSQAVACAEDPVLRRKLSRHARETALQQDWPKLIDRLERLFLTVTRASRGDEHESTAASAERP
jgi:glycosyltransferase involved in cell wall biosynthesis